ncbi:MAG TPA: aldehyde ferredoxin oxidoreductase C-terminal domain-containing protein [Actinocatenispora sp.]
MQALRILRAAVDAGHRDPYDPAVPLILTAGPLTGAAAPGTARVLAIGLSPLSGGVAETRAEGPFGAALVGAGADTLVLTGRAEVPSYVVVRDGIATLHDARHLWGLGTGAVTDALADEYGAAAGVAVIGPAGERGARYASVVTARHFPLPRLGFGALFGARNLKAVVCLGAAVPPVADPAALAALADGYAAEQATNPLTAWQHDAPGFGVWPGTVTDPGYGASRNYSDTTALPGPGLAPGRFVARLSTGGGCPACPTDCVKVFTAPGGAAAGLHQEAVAALGPNLGVDDADTVLAANARCQDLGLDPVSLGGTLGCLYEAAEAGLTPDDWSVSGFGTDPLPLIEETATGTGELAELLRGGAARLAAALGAPHLAMTVRGVELPPFEPRVQPGLALAYAIAPTGPRYDAVEHDLDFDPDEGKPHSYPELRRLGLAVPEPAQRLDTARAERTATLMCLWSALDALAICPYASTPTRPLGVDRIVALVRAVTGRAVTVDGLLALGAARLRAQHGINLRLGLGPDAGRLPDRMHTEPVATGRYAGAVLDRAAFTAALGVLAGRLALITTNEE